MRVVFRSEKTLVALAAAANDRPTGGAHRFTVSGGGGDRTAAALHCAPLCRSAPPHGRRRPRMRARFLPLPALGGILGGASAPAAAASPIGLFSATAAQLVLLTLQKDPSAICFSFSSFKFHSQIMSAQWAKGEFAGAKLLWWPAGAQSTSAALASETLTSDVSQSRSKQHLVFIINNTDLCKPTDPSAAI